MKKNRIILTILLLPIYLFADVVLTDDTYQKMLLRLKKDKQIIETEQFRWNKLKTAKPTINYKIENKKVVIQTIEIPVHKSKPLIYEVTFEVDSPTETAKLFPLQLFLAGTVETSGVDAKLGVQLVNIEKITTFPIGFNLLIGGRSLGGSVSYKLPKPLDNTAVHIYIGETYSLSTSFGIGVSLNF